MDGLLILTPRLETPLPPLQKRVHPAFDLRLLEIVLATRIDELRLPADQLQ